MRKSKHSDSVKVKAIQQIKSGISADIICREHGISRAMLYNWKSKFSGMIIHQVVRINELEDENNRLKQMYVDLALDHTIICFMFNRAFSIS